MSLGITLGNELAIAGVAVVDDDFLRFARSAHASKRLVMNR